MIWARASVGHERKGNRDHDEQASRREAESHVHIFGSAGLVFLPRSGPFFQMKTRLRYEIVWRMPTFS